MVQGDAKFLKGSTELGTNGFCYAPLSLMNIFRWTPSQIHLDGQYLLEAHMVMSPLLKSITAQDATAIIYTEQKC